MNFMVNETINIQRTCMHICMDMENRICNINLGLGIYIRVSVKITKKILALATSHPVPLCMRLRSPKHPWLDFRLLI